MRPIGDQKRARPGSAALECPAHFRNTLMSVSIDQESAADAFSDKLSGACPLKIFPKALEVRTHRKKVAEGQKPGGLFKAFASEGSVRLTGFLSPQACDSIANKRNHLRRPEIYQRKTAGLFEYSRQYTRSRK